MVKKMNFDKISEKIVRTLKKGLKREVNNGNAINYIQMENIIKNNKGVILVDVRSTQEYNEGHLNGAINIPLSELRTKANALLKYNDLIIVYCQMGGRSEKAVKILNKIGYSQVYNLEGGLDGI